MGEGRARRKIVVLAAVSVMSALATGGAVVATSGTASADVTWNAISAPLPAGAAAGQGMTLVGDACPAAGWCVAVGNYPVQTSTFNYTAGLIVVMTGSTSASLQAPLPPNASPTDPQALLTAVSCPQVGSCVAVGRYLDASGATQNLVEQLSGDVWTPSGAPMPADAVTTGGAATAQLAAVSCPTKSWCAAGGYYTSTSGAVEGFTIRGMPGFWAPAGTALPSAAGSQVVSLVCAGTGSCLAAGTYTSGFLQLGFADALASGSWTQTPLPFPTAASPFAQLVSSQLDVSCPAAGSCTVVGTAFDSSDWGFIDSLAGGSWSSVVAPQPDNVSSSDLQLTAVSCPDAATCIAVGSVNVAGADQGLVESLAGGQWSASLSPVPAGTDPSASVDVNDVSCPNDNTCSADGQVDTSGVVTGMMLHLGQQGWSAIPAPLPSDASASPDPSFAPLACPSVGACITGGTYLTSQGRKGVIEVDPSLAPTTTAASLIPYTATVIVYAASVSSSGAATGTVVFSSGSELLCSAALSNGLARCGGPLAPSSTVVASYSGDSADSPSWGSASNPYGPTTIAASAGTPQFAPLGAVYSVNLAAKVTNAWGTPVPGVPVTFNRPASGASGTFLGPSTVGTNSSGVATAPSFQANSKAGSYWVTGTVPGLWFALYSMTN